MAQSLLAHLYPYIKGSQEDIATFSLHYLLSQSIKLNAAFTKFAADTMGIELEERLQYLCQVTGESDEKDRPDMVGTDADGVEVTLFEMKFYASLTPNQPNTYLNRLRKNNGKGLLFICPTARKTSLWAKLQELCGTETTDVNKYCVTVNGINLAITTWSEVLGLLKQVASTVDTATYKYGTTNTITAPAKSGYDTPGSQSVKWDSTSAKTITFTYTPSYVATSQHLTSGWWYNAPSAGTGVSYSVNAEYQNRTANSVQIRIVWTQTIKQAAYGYNQYFYCSMWNNGTNRGNTGNVKIASTSTWPYYGSSGPWHSNSVTAYSGWITVPLDSPNGHGIEIACDWWAEVDGRSGSWGGKMIYVPAY